MRGSCWPECCSYKIKAALCSHRSQKNLCSDCTLGASIPFLSASVPGPAGWPCGLCKIAICTHWGLINICCTADSARGLFAGCDLLFLMELWGEKKKACKASRGDSGQSREKLPNRLIVCVLKIRIQKCYWPNRVLNGCCWLCVTPSVTQRRTWGSPVSCSNAIWLDKDYQRKISSHINVSLLLPA